MSAARQGASRGGAWIGELVRRPTGAFGVTVVAVLLASAALSLVWTPHPLLTQDVELR